MAKNWSGWPTEDSRILMVGHILRYHPAILKLQQLIRDGALGKINYLYSNRLNIGKIRTEENILWSFAPHDISVMLSLLNEMPTHVSCQGGAYLNRDVFDVTLSHFDFPSGVQAHIFVSWLHPFKEQRLVVVGSEKMAVFDDTAEHKLVLYPHKVEWRNRIPTAVKAEGEVVVLEDQEPLRAECQHFLDCVESRTSPVSDGDGRPSRPASVGCLPARPAERRRLMWTPRCDRPRRKSCLISSTNPPMSTRAPRSAPAPKSGISLTS